MSQNEWNEKTVSSMIRKLLSGAKVSEVAEHFGTGSNNIYQRLKLCGLSMALIVDLRGDILRHKITYADAFDSLALIAKENNYGGAKKPVTIKVISSGEDKPVPYFNLGNNVTIVPNDSNDDDMAFMATMIIIIAAIILAGVIYYL